MTLLHTESCDDLSSLGWDSAPGGITFSSGDRYPGDSQGNYWTISFSGGTANREYAKTIGASNFHSTFIVGTAVRPGTNSTHSSQIMAFYESTGSTRVATVWWISTSGSPTQVKLEVRAGSSIGGTLLATTAANVINSSGGAWYYLEVKYVIGAAGSIIIKINEAVSVSVSGIDTRNGTGATTLQAASISLQNISNSTNGWDLDDIYILNGAGSVNNDFLGDVRVLKIRPNANGSATNWTPGGSGFDATNHYLNVNSSTATQTTKYNASSTDEQSENYGMDNLPASATGGIYGVLTRVSLWETFAQVNVATTVDDGATEAETAEHVLTGALPGTGTVNNNIFTDVWETKPSGGVWDTTSVNAMKVGVRVKTIT